MGVSNTHVKHKGIPIRSKVSDISMYRISKRISGLLLYSQDYYKVFVVINAMFLMKII